MQSPSSYVVNYLRPISPSPLVGPFLVLLVATIRRILRPSKGVAVHEIIDGP